MNFRNFFLVALVMLPFIALQAQDDDMYFASSPKKTATKKQKVRTEQPVQRVQVIYAEAETDSIQGSERDVDEYNRRGPAARQFSYQLPDNDTLYVLEDTTLQTAAILNQVYAQGYDEGYADADDYYYSRRFNRFGYGFHYDPYYSAFYDPWYYDSWYWGYDPYWYGGWGYYGWHHPYWSPYYGWYDPYWYGGYYGGWYGGYYGGHYGGGRNHRTDGYVASRGGYTGRGGVNLGGRNSGGSNGRVTSGRNGGTTRFGAANNGYRFGGGNASRSGSTSANSRLGGTTTNARTGRVFQQGTNVNNTNNRTAVRPGNSTFSGGSSRSNTSSPTINRSQSSSSASTRTFGSSNSSSSSSSVSSSRSSGFSGGSSSSGGGFSGGGSRSSGGFSGGSGGRRGR